MQIKLEILEKDDEVIGFSENKLAVKKKTGEVEIFVISFDEDNLPRIKEETILITFGDSKNRKVTLSKPDSSVEVGTF